VAADTSNPAWAAELNPAGVLPGRGWDYATGLGSPDVYNLARDLVQYLRTHTCGPGA